MLCLQGVGYKVLGHSLCCACRAWVIKCWVIGCAVLARHGLGVRPERQDKTRCCTCRAWVIKCWVIGRAVLAGRGL